jgi:replicative DNA helicase
LNPSRLIRPDEEAALLGSLMFNREAINNVADTLRPEHFYSDFHSQIYRACLDLYKDGLEINNITVADRYEQIGGRDFPGIRTAIAHLLDIESAITPSVIKYYSQTLIDLYKRRQAIKIHSQGLKDLEDTTRPLGATLARSTELLFDLVGEGLESKGPVAIEREALPEALRRLEAARKGEGDVGVVPWPWPSLTGLTPLRQGEVTVVCGRPGMSKTSMALNAALHVARNNIPVGIFSLEMNKASLALRLISMVSGIDSRRIEKGKTTDEEHQLVRKAIEELARLPIHVDDEAELDEITFTNKARLAQQKFGLGLIILDYLQIMTRRKDQNDVAAVGSCARTVRKTARLLSIPVIEIAQVSRNCEYRDDKRPRLSDLKECVTGDTQLINATSGQWVEIRNIKPGTKILALGSNQKIDTFQVEDVWDAGIKTVFEVRTRTGRKIKTSASHPFLTYNGYRPLQNLRVGDEIATAMRLPAHGKENIEDGDICRLLGYLVGDGSYLRNCGIEFISSDASCMDDARQIVERYFPQIKSRLGSAHGIPQVSWSQTYINGYGKPFGNDLRNWINDIGIFGQRDHQKSIPAFVFESGEVGAKEFIAGYLSSDGCISRRSSGVNVGRWDIRFDSTSYNLLEQTLRLLLKLGIVAKIGKGYTSKVATKPIYRLSLASTPENLRKFAITIPCRGKKGDLLLDLLMSIDYSESGGTIFDLPKEIAMNITGRRFQGRHIRRSEARKWNLEVWANSDLLWERIEEITEIGQMNTYDVSVPGANNFVANGIIVHNSGEIEQEADIVLALYRDEYYNPPRQNKTSDGLCEINVLKHRNGPTGTVYLHFKNETTRFFSVMYGSSSSQ